ncbi:MAG: glycosyltransferase, partial [Anaerolineae bacterium]|nr:glycosyltransferase [Anaerolineae bacterium]
GHVRYLATHARTSWTLRRLLHETAYDLLYLNAVFATSTVYTLLLKRLGQLPLRPTVVAPRGNLSASALNHKSSKKRIFLGIARWLGLFRDVIWHATSEAEVDDILRVFGDETARRIELISNLPLPLQTDTESDPVAKLLGSARIAFLGRIAHMKNLTFALETLHDIQGNIEFDLWGPIEDEAYWERCRSIIETLPATVKVTHKGSVSPDRVLDTLNGYHLFYMPSLSENFGHVILEALCAGCPVLTSDQTPWTSLAGHQAGWALPLDRPELFRDAVQQVVDMEAEAMQNAANHAHSYGRSYVENTPAIDAMRGFLHRLTQP